MIRREVALTERALRTGQIIDLCASFGHDPTRQYATCPSRRTSSAFQYLAILIAQVLFAGHAGDDDHGRLAVEIHLLDEILEAVSLSVILEFEAHILYEFRVAEATNR